MKVRMVTVVQVLMMRMVTMMMPIVNFNSHADDEDQKRNLEDYPQCCKPLRTVNNCPLQQRRHNGLQHGCSNDDDIEKVPKLLVMPHRLPAIERSSFEHVIRHLPRSTSLCRQRPRSLRLKLWLQGEEAPANRLGRITPLRLAPEFTKLRAAGFGLGSGPNKRLATSMDPKSKRPPTLRPVNEAPAAIGHEPLSNSSLEVSTQDL